MSAAPDLIVFDATPLEVTHRSGVSHYVAHLLESLVVRRDGWQYALVASRALRGWIPEGTLGHRGATFPNRWLWMQFVLPLIVSRLQPRVCHFTNSVAPLLAREPYVLTIYDLSLFLFSRTQPLKSRALVRTLMPRSARRASAILALSHAAHRDIVKTLGVPAHKVHIVGAAAAPRFRVIDDRAELDRARRRYGLDGPFVLAVGTIEPRKNFARLVEAFADVRRQGRTERLVIVGQRGWGYGRLLARLERLGLGQAVQLLDYVSNEDLPALYNLASMLAFPSLYEGFGLPIIEAMACGTPVLTSDGSTTAEVANGAALLVDPTSVEALGEGLLTLLVDHARRAACRDAGLSRAAEFSWAEVARKTAAVYAGF